MNDLIAFLRARLDEDETFARGAACWYGDSNTPGLAPNWREVRVGHVWNDQDGGIVDADNIAALPHIVRHDPARVLAEVVAKRQLLELHMPIKDHGRFSEARHSWDCEGCPEPHGMVCTTCRDYAGDHDDAPCQTLRLIAAMHVDHPDFDESWRP